MNGVITLEHAIGRVRHRLYACRHVRHLSLSLSLSLNAFLTTHDDKAPTTKKQTNNLKSLKLLETTTTTLSGCHSQEEPCCISCHLHSDNRLKQIHIWRSQLSSLIF
jgi:hypothetical protein